MTAKSTADTASRPARTFPDQRHDLFLREGAGRFYWKLDNQGVLLSDDTLRWEHDGMPRERAFTDILSIRLQTAHVHKSGDIGVCQITFRDGLILTLQSSDARGYADDARAQAYAGFVRDLHARLMAFRPRDIRYLAGNSERWHMLGIAVLVVAGLFFVGLPLALFLYVRSWEVLGILATGAAFVWPVARVVQRNAPRDYAPTHVPDEMLP